MKTWKLELQEVMLLALLRAALQQQEVNTTCFQHATAENWLQCYLLAVHQGVAALAWEGVERLPVEFSPPLDVKLSWALVEKKQVVMPDVVKGIVKCGNPKCITNNEPMQTIFHVLCKDKGVLKCHYCEKEQNKETIKLL